VSARNRRNRRFLSWLPSIILVALIGVAAFFTVAINNSWWVDPTPTAGPDQTAPNGSSTFTSAGVDYFGRTGLVVIRMDSEALSAEELGLEPDGTQSFSAARPLRVQVVGPDGALAVDAADEVSLTTEDGELRSVDVLRFEPEGFVAAHSRLSHVADLYGWSADEVESLPERFGAARREDPDAATAITVGPGTNVGLAVSATLMVDGEASLAYTAEPLP
jgi:hypothetical protein